MKTVYIAGNMKDMPDDNAPAFIAKENELTKMGINFLTPRTTKAELGEGKTYAEYFRHSLTTKMLKCQIIVLIDGVQMSDGVKTELALAKSLAMPVVIKHYSVYYILEEQGGSYFMGAEFDLKTYVEAA